MIAGFAYPGGIDLSVCLLGFDASDYFRGPRRIQDITRKLGGRHAELPHGDPVAAREAFTAWYSERHGYAPGQDAVEALAQEWLGVMLPGTEHAVSSRRSAAFCDQITNWRDDEDAAGALLLLPEWIRWNGGQAAVPPIIPNGPVVPAANAQPSLQSSGSGVRGATARLG